jgi:hypothetical protein
LILALRDAVAFRALLADLEYADLVKELPCVYSRRLDDREGTDADSVPCWAAVTEFDEEIGIFYQGTLSHPGTPPYSRLFPRSLLSHDVFEEPNKVLTWEAWEAHLVRHAGECVVRQFVYKSIR